MPNREPEPVTDWVYSVAGAGGFASEAAAIAHLVQAGTDPQCHSAFFTPTTNWYFVDGLFGVADNERKLGTMTNTNWNPTTETCFESEVNSQIDRDRSVDCPTYFDEDQIEQACVNNKIGKVIHRPLMCATDVHGNPCDASTGDKIIREVDYSGPGIQFSRSYHSATMNPDERLGARWRHSYSGRVLFSGGDVTAAITPDGYHETFEKLGGNHIYVAHSGSGKQVRQDGAEWVLHNPSGDKRIFDSNGILLRMEAVNGQTTTITRDTSGRIDFVTGPFGHMLDFEYDLDGNIDRVIDPAGNSIVYDYDVTANEESAILVGVTYQDATYLEYKYESVHPGQEAFITGIVDQNGDRFATYDYFADGRVESSEHANGRYAISLTYTGTTTDVTDSGGGTTTYTYSNDDGGTRKALTRTLDGAAKTFNYREFAIDPQTRPEHIIDEQLIRTSYQYDQFPRTFMTEADGTVDARTTEYQYLGDSDQRLTKVISPSVYGTGNREIVTEYDTFFSRVLPKSIETKGFAADGTPVSRKTTLDYNAAGQINSIDGPQVGTADTTILQYYECTTGAECGQLQLVTDAEGNTTNFNEYDLHGRLLEMADANGLVTTYTYDVMGRLETTTVTPTVGPARVTTNTYDDVGQIETVTTPDGVVLTYTYDEAHDLDYITDNLGDRIDYDYDNRNNRTDEDFLDASLVEQRTLHTEFDDRNFVDLINLGGFTTDLQFDALGNLTEDTDPNFHITEHIYDDLNRLFRTVDALLGETDYGYDINDNLTSVTAPNGAVTTYQYDDLGNLLEEASADRGTITYVADAAGNITKTTDARNIVEDRVYDDLDRLTDILYPANPSLDVAFLYDDPTANAKGRIHQMDDVTGTTTVAYTDFGELDIETRSINGVGDDPEVFVIDYDYNAAGNIEKITLPDLRTVDYTFDAVGRVESVKTTFNGATRTLVSTVAYKPFGPMNQWTYGNGLLQTITYDQQYVASGMSVGSLFDVSYGLDAGGANIANITDNIAGGTDWNQTFQYDPLDRLDDEDGAFGFQDFFYDANGNRERIEDENQSILQDLGYETNSNRMDLQNANSVILDDSGNTTTLGRSSREYDYDERGRLVVSKISGAPNATYAYDGFGQLTHKVQKPNTPDEFDRVFLWGQDGKLIFESVFRPSGTRTDKAYIWLNGQPIAYLRTRYFANGNFWDEVLTYMHPDYLGTPRIGTDDSSTPAITWLWQSDAFGSADDNADPDGDGKNVIYRLRFPGQQNDGSTGMYYNYFRTYDPNTGRYLESDPIGLEGGLNTYGYAYQNPLTYTDPMGLDPATATATAQAALYCTGPQAAACAGGAAVAAVGLTSAYAGTKFYDAFAPQILDGIDAVVEACATESDDAREKRCNANLERDLATCAALGKRDGKSAYAICAKQAYLRYGNCLAGRDSGIDAPLPPFGTK